MIDQYDDWNAVVQAQKEMIKILRDENDKFRDALEEIASEDKYEDRTRRCIRVAKAALGKY